MRCPDFPCCGHVGDEGPCPDFDPETGEQLDMKCVCGVSVPLTSVSSLCTSCLTRDDDDFLRGEGEYFDDEEECEL